MTDLSKLTFFSGVNYLKRKNDLVDNELLTLTGGGGTVTKTVHHGLTYVPFFQVGADLVGDGLIWNNDIVNQYTETSLSGYNPPYPTLRYWCDENDLTITIENNTSPASSGTRRVYWAIYVDYTT